MDGSVDDDPGVCDAELGEPDSLGVVLDTDGAVRA